MNRARRFWVRTLLALLFAGLAWYCYHAGKAYNLLLENLPYAESGEEKPAMEALNVFLDASDKPTLLLEGDRIAVTVAGKTHAMRIDVLDPEDNVLGTRSITFDIDDLDPSLAVNVPKAYAGGGLK